MYFDYVFPKALIDLFLMRSFVLGVVGFTSVLCILVGLLHILRKWSDGY